MASQMWIEGVVPGCVRHDTELRLESGGAGATLRFTPFLRPVFRVLWLLGLTDLQPDLASSETRHSCRAFRAGGLGGICVQHTQLWRGSYRGNW